jgi:hypothetical protein
VLLVVPDSVEGAHEERVGPSERPDLKTGNVAMGYAPTPGAERSPLFSSATSSAVRYCPRRWTENKAETVRCTSCGSELPP